MINDQPPTPTQAHKSRSKLWFFDLLLIYVLLMGAYLRFTGLFWGDYQYLHPDERFLVWVGTDISPVHSLAEYFNTAQSTLNPNNVGHGFYVYGTLPMFLTRYLVQWIYGHSGFMEMTNVGRALSALADLLTVLLVFLVAERLYDKRVALLSAAFSAVAVLQIQQSHFFTMDTFINFFSFLAFYFAVRVMLAPKGEPEANDPPGAEFAIEKGKYAAPVRSTNFVSKFVHDPIFMPSLGFGIAFGLAMSSKLNAFPMAVCLPAAVLIRSFQFSAKERQDRLMKALPHLILAGLVSIFLFRIFQPYAFTGPGFFNVKLNPQWIDNLRALEAQTGPDVDFPPAMQWARRPVWFSGENLVLWGLGLPLGILAWAGFLWAGWRILKGEWKRHLLLWGWTGGYFVWQSLASNPTMRYQLPIYPTLVIFAGWAVIALWDRRPKRARRQDPSELSDGGTQDRPIRFSGGLAVLVGSLVLLLTTAYAIGFSNIYNRPITRVAASRWIYQNIPGPINLQIKTSQGDTSQPLPFPYQGSLTSQTPYIITFQAGSSGDIQAVYIPHAKDLQGGQKIDFTLTISNPGGDAQPLGVAALTTNLTASSEGRGDALTLKFYQPVSVEKGKTYALALSLPNDSVDQGASVSLAGATIANEGDWDDGLPLRMDGYDPFGGLYPTDVNFNMYTDDNPEKLSHFLQVLNESDYLLITSSRQWGSLPRIPERYPMTTLYYRNLIGCPAEKTIEWCYNVAQPGTFQGNLGYDLVKVFESDPGIGPLSINDQFAEEAFTVYDHPKVFVFRKSSNYDPMRAAQILGAVDFSQVIHIPPLQFASHPANLMLPSNLWATQQAGGTWSQLFDLQALQNRYPAISVIIWYLSVFLLGLFIYPVLRMALPGLSDRGYPVARTAGMLVLSYIVWLAGSGGIPFSRLTISIVIALIALLGSLLAFSQRQELALELRQKRRYYLLVEGLFLAFFIFDLLIRLGNPDLWHPYKGGEKPMDFSYFNAVLKSTTFPPYDPWYAGGYLNYYYYGFVFVGVLVKWLGIVPAVAYNLILPTIFAMIAMGAFSLGWNLISAVKTTWREHHPPSESEMNAGEPDPPDLSQPPPAQAYRLPRLPFVGGISAALGMAVLGNLGTVRMIVQGYQKLAAPGGTLEGSTMFARWVWGVRGFIMALGGASLPYNLGDWYWNPSRAIPAPNDVEPITEFPFFTVLYGDPHAHLFAMPIALLALTLILGLVLGRAQWKNKLGIVFGFGLAGLAIGALRPTNTWDFYPYLALGVIAVAYSFWAHYRPSLETLKRFPWWGELPAISRRLLVVIGAIALLVGLSFVLFQPYAYWYGQGYGKIQLWQGGRTPTSAYLWHWGLFLFIIVSWMTWETRDWMANTPASALRKLEPYRGLIEAAILLLVLALLGLLYLKIAIAWLVLPLAAWAGVLILRPNQPDAKRFILFLIGTGLVLTLMVEIIVLVGDIGRMNTVFKFYLQVWTFFAISSGAALGWLVLDLHEWLPKWRTPWQLALAALVFGAALYPLMGGLAKIKDRMVTTAPHTLDGMLYMDYAHYEWHGDMDLSQDYRAIRWMQENVQGSSVIVEANLRDLYRWGSRFSIYTGLPGVVGWEWHEQQQRTLVPSNWISERIDEINNFYTTTNVQAALEFLRKYNVKYIIDGQLEHNQYPGPGLDKFSAENGILWDEVYRDGDTVIYQVRQP
jgi:YYY domain-containing protein